MRDLFLRKIEKVMDIIEKFGAIICGISIMIMMCYTTIDVAMRIFTNITFTGTYERVQAIFMPLGIFPGLAFCYHAGVLPKFDSFEHKGSPTVQKLIQWSIAIIELICLGLLAYFSWSTSIQAVRDNMGIQAGGTVTPTWWVYFGVTFGFNTLFIEALIYRIKKLFPQIAGNEEPVQE